MLSHRWSYRSKYEVIFHMLLLLIQAVFALVWLPLEKNASTHIKIDKVLVKRNNLVTFFIFTNHALRF